jgi:hypothetical protein
MSDMSPEFSELQKLEERLRRLRPAAVRWSEAEFWFRAGQRLGRRCWLWPSLVGVLALLSSGLGVLLLQRPTAVVERIVYIPVPMEIQSAASLPESSSLPKTITTQKEASGFKQDFNAPVQPSPGASAAQTSPQPTPFATPAVSLRSISAETGAEPEKEASGETTFAHLTYWSLRERLLRRGVEAVPLLPPVHAAAPLARVWRAGDQPAELWEDLHPAHSRPAVPSGGVP